VEKGELMRLMLQIVLPAVTAGVIGYVAAAQFDLASYMSFFTPNNTAFMCAVVPIIGFYLSVLIRAPRQEKGPIGALLAIFAVVIIFWMVFHQNGNTLTLWARDHTDRVAGKMAPVLNAVALDETAPESYWANVPLDERPAAGEEVALVSTELFQSINPFFIILFTPLVVGFFAWLQVRNKEPSTPAKIAWGLLLTAASVLVMVIAVHMTHGGTVRGSAVWLFLTYGIVTLGELCLSPMGLSLVSKLAPARLTALMMGGWFLATSIGNKLSGVIGGLWELIPLQGIFWINAISALAAAGMIALLVPWIRRVMAEHEQNANNS
jgi:POT family proton-dependent oligopeptide transporter